MGHAQCRREYRRVAGVAVNTVALAMVVLMLITLLAAVGISAARVVETLGDGGDRW